MKEKKSDPKDSCETIQRFHDLVVYIIHSSRMEKT